MRIRSSAPRSVSWLSCLAAALTAAIAVLAPGCQGQGEGQICNPYAGNGGDDDCQSGFVCTSIMGVLGSRCCPSDLQNSKTPICKGSVENELDANPAPPDAVIEAATEAAAADAPAEGAADASAEGASDAAVADAPSE